MKSAASFADARQQADITEDAKHAGMDDFSQAIRKRDISLQIRTGDGAGAGEGAGEEVVP
jgi:hypothetical protein